MITNNKIKTTSEAIHYLNEVVLGMSASNGVIVKDYTGSKPLQDRVSDLETYGVPVELISEINATVSQLEAILEQYLDDPTGWTQLTTILDPAGQLYIKRIGEIVNIQGFFELINAGLIITTLPAQFIPTRDINIEVLDANTPKIYSAIIYTATGNIVLDESLVNGGEKHYINATYLL